MPEIQEPNRDFKASMGKEIEVKVNSNVRGIEVHREIEKIEVKGKCQSK